MKQQKTLFTVLLATLGGLVLLGLCLVLPLMLSAEEDVTPPIETLPGEGTSYGKIVLYGPYDRDTPDDGDLSHNIKQITVCNREETYSFVHPPKEKETDREDYINFLIEQDGKLFSDLMLDPQKLASIIVAAGTPYARDTRVAEGEDAVARYGDYGLAPEDDPPYVELTLYNSETFRIYVGDATNDKTGYYVRLDGRDVIYVTITSSLGDLVNSGAGYYVSATVIPAPKKQYGEYFVDDFELLRETHVKEGTVSETMAVAVRQRVTVTVEGNAPTTREETVLYNFNKSSVPAFVRDALVGQPIGEALSLPDTVWETTVDTIGGGSLACTYTYTFLSVEYRIVYEEDLAFSFVKDATDRDFFKSAPLYSFRKDTALAPYTTNDNVIMAMLEKLSALTGDSVHSLGVTDEDIDEYGLYTTLSFRIASTFEMTGTESVSNIGANDVTVKDEDYIDILLYIGDVREDGTRLVASSYYDLIAVVSGDTFDFLDYDSFTWIKPNLISCYVALMKTYSFSFDYEDLNGDFVFDLAGVRTHVNEAGDIKYDSLPLNEKQVAYEEFTELYTFLLWQNYEGKAALSDAELADLTENGRAVMTMTVTLTDGRVVSYRFIPYSLTKTLVAVDDGGVETALFYVRSSITKTLAADLIAMSEGKAFDPADKYGD